MNRLKVGVVGCGLVAEKRHMPGFARLRDRVTVEAVCDMNEVSAKRVAKMFHVPKIYTSLTKMLSKESLDIVDVCTPPQTHIDIGTEAMDRGCHVLLEKPLALSTFDCDRLIDSARRNQITLCVVHNFLFHDPMRRARKMYEDGKIGDLVGLSIHLSDPRDGMISWKDHWVHKIPGGVLGETGPHAVYISLAFLQNIVAVDIYAKKILDYPWARFDEFRIQLDGGNTLSSIALQYTAPRGKAEIDLIGSKRVLRVDLHNMTLISRVPRDLSHVSIAKDSLETAFRTVTGVTSNALKSLTRTYKLGHDYVIEKFVESLVKGSTPPVTGEQGREVVWVMGMIVDKLYQKYGEPD